MNDLKKPERTRRAPNFWLRRLGIILGVLLVVAYAGLVLGGYAWLRWGQKFEHVRLFDVACFNLPAVKRSMAASLFLQAKQNWEKKNYQAAYVAYNSAVRKDPANVAARLEAATFLGSLGGAKQAEVLLEEGLVLVPQDRRLIDATFSLLLAQNRPRDARKLLHQVYPAGPAGAHALVLERYEVQATLAGEGAPAARALLEKYPELERDPAAGLVAARVRWESGDRAKAISLLGAHLDGADASPAEYARLSDWQIATRMFDAAIATAQSAAVRFPANPSAQVLLIKARAAAAPGGRPDFAAIAAYLRTWREEPRSLLPLATLAGERGWADVTRVLFDLGVVRGTPLLPLALACSDALLTRGAYNEAAVLLAGLEAQAPEANQSFTVQLRQRQVIAAAALGNEAGTRDYARRLRLALDTDAEGLEFCRRLFARLGINEAVAELTTERKPRSAVPAPAGRASGS